MIEAIAGPHAVQQDFVPVRRCRMTAEEERQVNQLLTLGWRPGGRRGQCMLSWEELRRVGPCRLWTAPDGAQRTWEEALAMIGSTEKKDAEGSQTVLDPRD